MSRVARSPEIEECPPRLYTPIGQERNAAYWRINGYGARIVVWTAEEFEHLAVRPIDAQYYPCGVWCALRMEE